MNQSNRGRTNSPRDDAGGHDSNANDGIRESNKRAGNGAFAQAARDMATYGLAVLPLGGEDGKKPLVSRWSKWKRPPGSNFIDKMIGKHGSANIGIVCGPSQVTVVDIDDPDITDELVKLCGDTPLKTRTPSGGLHLYYQNSGERNANLRRLGFAADVRGHGGMIVTPPSMRPASGLAYGFLDGTWNDLSRLPCIKPGSLESLVVANVSDITIDDQQRRSIGPQITELGSRNDTLFRTMLRAVKRCDNLDQAMEQGQAINERFSPPLPSAEVIKTVANVWQRETAGLNWVGQEPHISLPMSQWAQFSDKPDALFLLGYLRANHAARIEPFPISPKAMAKANVIGGWGRKRYAKSRDWLVDQGWLVCRHKGGKAPGDASTFTFGSVPYEGGPERVRK